MMFQVKRYVQNANECSKNSYLFLFQDNPELHTGSKVYRLEASAGGGVVKLVNQTKDEK